MIITAFAWATWGPQMCKACVERVKWEERMDGKDDGDVEGNGDVANRMIGELKAGVSAMGRSEGLRVDGLEAVLSWVEELVEVPQGEVQWE